MSEGNEDIGLSVEDSNTAFTLHPKLAIWIDEQSSHLANLVHEISNEMSKPKKTHIHPDLPVKIKITDKDVIGDVVQNYVDLNGEIVSRIYQNGSIRLTLDHEGLKEAKKIVERIWSKRELRDKISGKTLLELLLDYAGKTTLGTLSESFSKIITEKIRTEAKHLTVWVPIDDFTIQGELEFATSVLEMLSREKLLAMWKVVGASDATPDTTPLLSKIEDEWVGRGLMRFTIFSEPQRAREIALERATDYMTLLNFYTPSTRILSLTSHTAPRGKRPSLKEECIVYGLDMFKSSEGFTEQRRSLLINYDILEDLKNAGFITLSNLATKTNCSYEEDLLSSLLVYGRACYQLDPMDKFLQIMTSLEMFCLRNDNEPIQSALADRLAFSIAQKLEDRQKIVRNLRDAYKVRSGRTHHGKSIIDDTEIVEQFLNNAWMFFLNAINSVGLYQTREEFLSKLDEIKYT